MKPKTKYTVPWTVTWTATAAVVSKPPLPPSPPNTARLQIKCPSCGLDLCIQANAGQPVPIVFGCYGFPVDNTLVCPSCNKSIDLADRRTQLEKQFGKKIM